MRCRILIWSLAGIAILTATATSPAEVVHLTEHTVAEVGRTRVIAFSMATGPQTDQELPCEVADADVLEIAGPATIGAGRLVGCVRVRGVRPGSTTLTVDGSALAVEVVMPRGPVRRDHYQPRIVGPVTGAVVWGAWTIGVELREPLGRPRRRVEVRLPDGRRIEPTTDTGSRLKPFRQLAFEIDTSEFPDGPLDLVPVAEDAEGAEQAGPLVRVRVVHPATEDVIAGEAEDRYEVDRPQRFRDDRINVGRDAAASGGAYFVNASAYPAVCCPVEVDQTGWYQVMLTAGGRRAQGALPTVGIVVDGANQSTTNGRLLQEQWHRFAVGVPIRLEAGERLLTPYFANDFYVAGKVDRNLYLDRIEIARLADASGDDAAGTAGTMAAGSMMEMDMAMAGNGATASVVDDPYGLSAVPLRIGFVRPLDGNILPGLFEVEGRCWWDGSDRVPAPVVTLMINGEAALVQRTGAPRFWVDPSHFTAGANRVQLVAALDSGATARTPVQTLHWPAAAAVGDRPPARRHRRFSIHDDRWAPDIRQRLRNAHNPKERRAAGFSSNGEAVLNLPEDLEGSFRVLLNVRGDDFDGPAVATVTLRRGDEVTLVGTVEARGWWTDRQAGTVELAAGPKQLVVSFENDKYEKDKGDRNLWLQAVLLAQEPVVADRTPPVVDLRYPPDGQRVFAADAVVAQASDNASLASAELIVDGMPTEITVNLNLRPGRIVFPLLLRNAEPGEHTVAVRVTDVAGNSALSAPRLIVVTDAAPTEWGTYDRAVHLLNRFGFGPDTDELAAILTMGRSAWLTDRLNRPLEDPGDLAAFGAAFPYFVGRNNYEVPRRVIAHALLTPNPVRARFVLWAQNHFSTWIRKTAGDRKWREHVSFSRLGPAPFDQLLFASAESPAMLVYLDQQGSYTGRINENYSREIMELHTLGVDGGYTQQDVTNLASVLTGWTAALQGDGRGGGEGAVRYTFRFDRRLNDASATRLLGVPLPAARTEGQYDRVRFAFEMLASHPSTARFVSRKLAEHYVRVPAPDELVEDLAGVFLETGGDMKAVLVAMAGHPAFWNSGERIAQPLEYAVRQCRVTRNFQPWQIADYLQRSGTGLFDCATPDGYPQDDASYSGSNALIQRWRFAAQRQWPLVGLVPGRWRHGNALPEAEWSQQVTDIVAVRLTGRLLGETSNRASLDLVAASPGNRDQRARALATFIAQLPEANLR